MKNLLLFSTILTILFSSCTKEPYADFITSKTSVETGELVYFTNRSFDALSYEWDFGDGYFSSNFNASHLYESPGKYQVRLTAFGKDGKVDQAFMEINVFVNLGSLRILITELNLNYVIAGARIRLYPSVKDWENETNKIAEGTTNSQGVLIFENLPASRVYYVDIYEARHNNYDLSTSMITTPVLLPGMQVNFNGKAELSVGDLEITALEYFNKYPIYNASVRLYPSVKDWEDETNMIVEGFTNTQGRVIFQNLDAKREYFVDVWEANHDNYKLAAEDVGFIKTIVLLPGVVNYWTAYVDYYLPGKKAFNDRKSLKKHYKTSYSTDSPRIPLQIKTGQ